MTGKYSRFCRTVEEILLASMLAGVFIATILAQHPHILFNRMRSIDRLGLLLPNWKFFAPVPAQTDYHLLYRTVRKNGETSLWHDVHPIQPRYFSHAFWFPSRRTDKAIFDSASELLSIRAMPRSSIEASHSFRILADFISKEVPAGPSDADFQFMIASAAGYDESIDPRIDFVSGLVPLGDAGPDRQSRRGSRAHGF